MLIVQSYPILMETSPTPGAYQPTEQVKRQARSSEAFPKTELCSWIVTVLMKELPKASLLQVIV